MAEIAKTSVEDIELSLFLEGIFRRYGYDFRDYAPASLQRRIRKCMRDEQLHTVSALQDRVLHDPAAMQRFLHTVSIDVTAMFRDPTFYCAFRQRVVPLLRSQPSLRIWHAGCAAGEEVYSMAILLQEEGLSERSRLYATDMNTLGLDKGKAGIFRLKAMQGYTENYQKAGGKRSFSEYYSARYDHAIFQDSLKQNIVWAEHNLVTDRSFNEFQVILCRNVLIYFNQSLQKRVHKLLYESLALQGILALGSKETLQFTPYADCFESLDDREKIFRKVK
ncbi:MAG: protein-glutamate O-methyltransferase CheR [Deltaproteobacteria bacterium]|nr:protein-glutamate O-methyltransferase CheR [Deltaproteobacteria bacterium]